MNEQSKTPEAQRPPRAGGLSTRTALWLLTAVTVVCLAPFANKAFHIDDPLFLWTAAQIRHHPLDFYGFTINWYGWDMPAWTLCKNPPLAAYYLAGATSLVGWGEVGLHLAFLLTSVAAVLGAYFLAGQFCSRPLLPALITALSPVFLLSGSGIMCDTLTLAFWIWAIFFWVRGLNRDSNLDLAVSGMLIALSALTKYSGMDLLPLLAVYSLVKRRGLGRWVLFFLIPVAALAAYQWATHKLYGRGLLSDVGAYSGT